VVAPGTGAVVHVSEALGGGVLRVVQALADATADEGVPTVVLHGRRPETPEFVQAGFDTRVRTVEVPGWGTRSARGALGTARAAAAIQRELSRHGSGVLHLHSTFAGIVGRSIPAHGWRVYYTPHAYAFLNPSVRPSVRVAIRALERLLAARAHTVACSRTEGLAAERLAGGAPVTVIQNGIEVRDAAKLAVEPSGTFVVASVGRAAYQRRPDLVAAAAAGLGEDLQARFVWFGDGPLRKVLTDRGVEVTGWLAERDAEQAFGQANVVLHLSAFEGLPIALLEAMAAGRAIVASDLPSIREVVGDTAVLVTSAAEASGAIRLLHEDPELRARLGAAARERVARLFTRARMVERMLATYGEAARGATSPGSAV
jgi:glycosyltransferase involved in cell wall biosynthesis